MLCKHVTSYMYMRICSSRYQWYCNIDVFIVEFRCLHMGTKSIIPIYVQYEIDFDICVRSWFESQSWMTKVKTDSVSTNVKRSATTRLEWHGSFRWDHKDQCSVSSQLNDRQSSAPPVLYTSPCFRPLNAKFREHAR